MGNNKNSRLILSLREGIDLVQMILFKEIKQTIEKESFIAADEISMLTGAVINEIFGNYNREEKFLTFRERHIGEIEQILLDLKKKHSFLCRHLTDALRIQTLCDNQEGKDSSRILVRAKNFGYLLEHRDVPLPSTFMTTIRELGKQYKLIVPPIQITQDEDQSIVH